MPGEVNEHPPQFEHEPEPINDETIELAPESPAITREIADELPPVPDEPAPATPPRPKPVSGAERRVALDVLRGVAVFGILFVNIESFSMITSARRNPVFGGGPGDWNQAIWTLTMALADTKFIALFGMMFGAGAVIICKRWAYSGHTPIFLYYRRMIVLALIGAAHGFLLWDGDILFFYGVYGCLLFPLMWLRGYWLVLLGIAGIYAKGHYFGWPHVPQHLGAGMYEYHALMSGWIDQFRWRKEETYYTYKFGVKQYALQGIGFMLIGMGLVKGGVITGHRSRWTYLVLAILGFGIGIPLSGFLTDWFTNFEDYRGAVFVFGSLLVTFGWMGAAIALAVYAPNFFFTKTLANVGRMALTNYLGQTIICTTIFYGHGFGKFATVDRVEQMKIVLAICAAQLIFSTLWLQLFRFGPFEWVWRMATYLRYQPLLRRSHSKLETPNPKPP